MIEVITEAFGEPSARLSNTVGVFSAMTRSPILDARFLVSIERKRSSPLRQTVRSAHLDTVTSCRRHSPPSRALRASLAFAQNSASQTANQETRELFSLDQMGSARRRIRTARWYRRVRPLCYGTITAAPSMESAFKALSASFTLSRENVVTFGRSLISAAIARKSRASDRVILVTLRI
jgi:hypothetical protein